VENPTETKATQKTVFSDNAVFGRRGFDQTTKTNKKNREKPQGKRRAGCPKKRPTPVSPRRRGARKAVGKESVFDARLRRPHKWAQASMALM
jgi:hypothetical protein